MSRRRCWMLQSWIVALAVLAGVTGSARAGVRSGEPLTREFATPARYSPASAQTTHPLDPTWSDEFALPGFDGTVEAAIADSGALLVVGSFKHFGTLSTRSIVRWDGSTFTTFGAGPPIAVRCALRHPSGLIVGGWTSWSEYHGGGNYRWDGAAWLPMPRAFDSVRAMAMYRGELIEVGVSNPKDATYVGPVGRWDGSQWSPLGSTTGILARPSVSRRAATRCTRPSLRSRVPRRVASSCGTEPRTRFPAAGCAPSRGPVR